MKTFLTIVIALVAAVALPAAPARAAVIDTLDNTNNFFASFGGTTATANGDGTATLTRTVANQDAGIDWRNGGASGANLSMSTENILTISPVAPVNGGFWNASILFFNNGSFIDQKTWIADTQTTSAQSTDIVQFALANGVSGANEYFVRFRVQPFDQSNVGFTFTEISAVPEPSTLVLVAFSLLVLSRHRKCRPLRGDGTSEPRPPGR